MKEKDSTIAIKRPRIDETSFIRAIACLAVVLVHITASPMVTLLPYSVHSYIFTILNRGVRFTTPTFLFLSAFTLFYRYQDGPFHYGRFLKKRFASTLIPYSVWYIIYYLIHLNQGGAPYTPVLFFETYFYARIFYHLYFIATISQFYLLFGVFRYAYKKWNSHLLLAISLLANLWFSRNVVMQYSDRFFMTYIFFFSLGCYVARNLDWIKEKIIKWNWFLFGGYAVIVSIDIYYSYRLYVLKEQVFGYLLTLTWMGFAFFAIFALYGFANKLYTRCPKAKKPFQTIAQSSYYVYLAHPAVLWFSDQWLLSRGVHSITLRAILNVVIVYSVTLFFAIGYSTLKKRITTKSRTN